MKSPDDRVEDMWEVIEKLKELFKRGDVRSESLGG